MEKGLKELKSNVCNILLTDIQKENTLPLGFTIFLERFANKYNLGIEQLPTKSHAYNVYGDKNSFRLWGDMVYFIKWLETKGLILYYEQINGQFSNDLQKIGNCDSTEPMILDGDIKNYIKQHLPHYIWISPELESYVNHNFMTDELYEAKRQTCYARWTLFLAIATFVAQIVFSKICGC